MLTCVAWLVFDADSSTLLDCEPPMADGDDVPVWAADCEAVGTAD